ncbi:MAG TPA: sugar phosphate isomerase/epimerase family protein [Bryobacteraceae bacterium]|jgi:sugar phosphate isomerase/epimerase|nr:sugar phosphate isomerase/epimerase family protein [Bryobacteraceae bacterium]
MKHNADFHLSRRQVLAGAAVLAAASPLSAFKSRITKASISAITDEIGKTQAEAIDFAHHYGLSCVELRNIPETRKEVAKMTEPEVKAVAAQLGLAKLKVTFLNTSLLKFNWPGLQQAGAAKPAEQKRWDSRKQDVETALRAANILGVDKVRVFTGKRVAHPETVYKLIAQTMEELLPMAEKAKVHLLIENEYSQNIGNSAESRDIMAMLPSKWIGLNWDPGNAQFLKEKPFPDGYALVPKDRILNIQFKAQNTLDGPDKMDWKAVLEALEKDNYKYKLGLETHGDAAKRMEHAHASMEEMLRIVGSLS